MRDSYVFEFLDLEEPYKEKDLRRQIVSHLKDFILEFGHDFTFVGEEYRVQVGNTDFFIDLLFYNRALSCLVAIKLKIQSRKHCRKNKRRISRWHRRQTSSFRHTPGCSGHFWTRRRAFLQAACKPESPARSAAPWSTRARWCCLSTRPQRNR